MYILAAKFELELNFLSEIDSDNHYWFGVVPGCYFETKKEAEKAKKYCEKTKNNKFINITFFTRKINVCKPH